MDKGILWRAGLVLGFALIIWAGYSSSQDMRDGATAQQGKRYDQAIAIYEPIAEKGSWSSVTNPLLAAAMSLIGLVGFRPGLVLCVWTMAWKCVCWMRVRGLCRSF